MSGHIQQRLRRRGSEGDSPDLDEPRLADAVERGRTICVIGVYRTFWSLLDPDDPSIVTGGSHDPLIEPSAALTNALRDLIYIDNVVFTTGIADGGDHFIVASGEVVLACRITHVPKSALGLLETTA